MAVTPTTLIVRTLIVALAAAAIGMASYGALRLHRRTEWQTARHEMAAELQPVAIKDCQIKRYGSTNDGGYLMCENLLRDVQSAYSYGIDQEDNWGCQVGGELHVPLHQYDCFTEKRPPCPGVNVTFHDECIGDKPEQRQGQPFDTLARQIAKNGDAGKRLLVKMDVEGAEWESLLATSDEVLDTIDQLPMELHGVDPKRSLEVVRKLKRHFYLVSLHFNNWSCDPNAAPFPATAVQALWVNKRLATLDPQARPRVPGSWPDAPDNPRGPDCQSTNRSPTGPVYP